MMDNVIRCSTCGRTIIADEEFTHKCQFDAIDIPVSSFFERKTRDHESIIAFGLNGKSYRFVKRFSVKPRGASDEKKQQHESDEDKTAPENAY